MAQKWMALSRIVANPRVPLRGCGSNVQLGGSWKNFHIISTGPHIDNFVITLRGANTMACMDR